MKASISVVTYNRKELTKVCLDSIIQNTPEDAYELIVVDNASTDGTQDLVRKYNCNYTFNPKNFHLGYAINQAYWMADPEAEWLITFANDEYAMPGWFENFQTVVEDLKPDYVYCMMRIASFKDKHVLTTKNGGKYMSPCPNPEIGATFAIRQEDQRAWNIWFNPSPWRPGYGSPFSILKIDLDNRNLKGVELAKPCVLIQNCGFNTPEYHDYYMETWGIRDKLERWERLKKTANYVDEETLKEYYEGSGYGN